MDLNFKAKSVTLILENNKDSIYIFPEDGNDDNLKLKMSIGKNKGIEWCQRNSINPDIIDLRIR